MNGQNNVMSDEISAENNLFDNFTSIKKSEMIMRYSNQTQTSANGTNNTEMSTKEEYLEDLGIDYTKLWVMSAICIGTIIGNVAVILAIVARNIKMTRMYYFIIHLSIADLLTALLTLLPEIVWTATIDFYGGNVVCKLTKFAQMIGPYLSSYVLVMTAIDRYQAICNPLSNCSWTPKRSHIMIAVAWTISLLLCIPQTIIFSTNKDEHHCGASFVKGWGVKAYVVWYGISNFFVPLVILAFCYLRICYVIWENFNSKTINLESTNETISFKERIYKTFGVSNCQKWGLRKKINENTQQQDENCVSSHTNAAETFRVHNEESLEKIQWQNQPDCDDDDEAEYIKENTPKPSIDDELEMKPLIEKVSATDANGVIPKDNNHTDDEKLEENKSLLGNRTMDCPMDTNAIVEPVFKIQIEPPSNNSNSGAHEGEVMSKVYVEFKAGKVNYPHSESDSQSSGSTHKTLERVNHIIHNENMMNVEKTTRKEKKANDGKHPRFNLRRSSSCELNGTPNEEIHNSTKTEKRRRFFQKSKSLNDSAKPRQNSISNLETTKINPRTHSTKGISKAKIKTIKLTVAVILGYILCSAPFIVAQIWGVFGRIPQILGEYMMILYYCMTLNSVVNPWIYMMFNRNLVESLWHLLCPCTGCSGGSGICPCKKDQQRYGNQRPTHVTRPG